MLATFQLAREIVLAVIVLDHPGRRLDLLLLALVLVGNVDLARLLLEQHLLVAHTATVGRNQRSVCACGRRSWGSRYGSLLIVASRCSCGSLRSLVVFVVVVVLVVAVVLVLVSLAVQLDGGTEAGGIDVLVAVEAHNVVEDVVRGRDELVVGEGARCRLGHGFLNHALVGTARASWSCVFGGRGAGQGAVGPHRRVLSEK